MNMHNQADKGEFTQKQIGFEIKTGIKNRKGQARFLMPVLPYVNRMCPKLYGQSDGFWSGQPGQWNASESVFHVLKNTFYTMQSKLNQFIPTKKHIDFFGLAKLENVGGEFISMKNDKEYRTSNKLKRLERLKEEELQRHNKHRFSEEFSAELNSAERSDENLSDNDI